MKPKNKIVTIFLTIALVDILSFLILTGLQPGLEAYEDNLAFRHLGLIPAGIILILCHAGIVYYIYNPFLRSKWTNYCIASLIILLSLLHLLGLYSNVWAYNQDFVANGVAPQSDKDSLRTLLIFSVALYVIFLLSFFTFRVYSTLDDIHSFEDIDPTQEVKNKIKGIMKNHKGH